MILAGDIGGTKTNLAFFEEIDLSAAQGTPVVEQRFPSREYGSLDEIVRRFVTEHRLSVKSACFGIAGPVRQGCCEATNLPWVVDSQRLACELGIETVGLINDLEANAYGIPALQPEDFAVLNEGAFGDGATKAFSPTRPLAHSPTRPLAESGGANAAIIAAGTGLGEAGMFWDGLGYRPLGSEGGHTDFAPSDELELELYSWLHAHWPDHVSWERVLSGPGLQNIYRFLRDTGRGEEPAWLAEAIGQGDPSAAISRAALEGRSALCRQALDMFVAFYGVEAGNLALTFMATGGLFVGGGIAPKILDRMKSETFMQRFTAKGRLRPLMETIPVRVILNEKTALLGAARAAGAAIGGGA
jgi:glucokinase